MGGGGILDVGCYTASMSRLIAGATLGQPFADPLDLHAVGHLGSTGVDDYTVAVARFPGDVVAQLATGVQVTQENVVRVFGTRGRLFIPSPWAPARDGGTQPHLAALAGRPRAAGNPDRHTGKSARLPLYDRGGTTWRSICGSASHRRCPGPIPSATCERSTAGEKTSAWFYSVGWTRAVVTVQPIFAGP